MTEGQIRNNNARNWWDALTFAEKNRIRKAAHHTFSRKELNQPFNEVNINRRHEIIFMYQLNVNNGK